MATTTTPEPRISAPRPGAREYDAFVSYSHAADGRLAPALQRGLQSLAKPWYRRRALRVFRRGTARADARITIPMTSGVESLNAAVATALAVAEARRQRTRC